MNIWVSVIVPVYNVELYLKECIDSIINQTFEDIEMILVDDGSTDNSGRMCDEFLNVDSRIRVIHKKNGGLSSARNAGLEIAQGKYISFVDSDDYLNMNMIYLMVKTMEKSKADIVCCDFTSEEFRHVNGGNVISYTRYDAISMLLDDSGFKCYAWNKLYKKDLFGEIRYPDGKLFEDIKTSYLLFKNSSKITYLKEELYFYRIREGSITKYKFTERNHDEVDAINFVMNDASNTQPFPCDIERFALGFMGYYLCYVKKGIRANANIQNDVVELKAFIKENFRSIFNRKNISKKKKIQLLMFFFMEPLFRLSVYMIARRNR